jgi:hypothetical protein
MFVRWKRRQELERIYWETYHQRAHFARRDGRAREAKKWQAKADAWPEHRMWISEPTGQWIKTAHLIEAIRTPDGPRQRYVGRLGSFREGTEGDPEVQAEFWDKAKRELIWIRVKDRDAICLEDCNRILASLQEVIPSPGPIPVNEEDWEAEADDQQQRRRMMIVDMRGMGPRS